jgi:hypothetical protein
MVRRTWNLGCGRAVDVVIPNYRDYVGRREIESLEQLP